MLDIGKWLYTHEIRMKDAIGKYEVSRSALEYYKHLYMSSIGVRLTAISSSSIDMIKQQSPDDLAHLQSLSKEELIDEVILAKVNEERAKKGYVVRGGGPNKEYISINSKNSK